MALVGVRHADGAILTGGPTDKCPEDRGDGVQELPGCQGAGRQGIHP